MRRLFHILIVLAVAVAFFWLLPPFRVVRTNRGTEHRPPGTFNAAEFVERFWTNQLLPAVPRAVAADELVALLRTDPAAARQKFGRSLGLSQTCNFFLRGTGTVVSASDTEVLLTVTPSA
ncbi:MAG: DUF2291 family protein, partial [Verrucomicrobiae bacterium]|nr:DUF2291 family protein [Verrucomicrobiae bacterium]